MNHLTPDQQLAAQNIVALKAGEKSIPHSPHSSIPGSARIHTTSRGRRSSVMDAKSLEKSFSASLASKLQRIQFAEENEVNVPKSSLDPAAAKKKLAFRPH